MADIQIPSTSEPTLAEDNHLDISQTPNPTDAEHEETGQHSDNHDTTYLWHSLQVITLC